MVRKRTILYIHSFPKVRTKPLATIEFLKAIAGLPPLNADEEQSFKVGYPCVQRDSRIYFQDSTLKLLGPKNTPAAESA